METRNPHRKQNARPTQIGLVGELLPGTWVVCQRQKFSDGGLWQLDQIVVSQNMSRETMRGNNKIDYSLPIFYRPNFISDVIHEFGL